MKSNSNILGLTLATALLAGCSAGQVAVRPDATANIHTVALITVSEPQAYVAQDFGNPGMMFGAVGGAVAGASSANAGKNLDQIASEAGFAAGDALTRSLQQQLAAAGYEVKLISVPRDNGGKLLKSYDTVDAADADAILDVAIESIGYATEHPMFSPHWRPAAQVHVALVDSRTHSRLYGEKFMYGYHNPLMSGTDLEAPETYHFESKDVLFSDSARLVDGMQDSVAAVTGQIAQKLKK